MIKLDNLSLAFGDRTILHGVTAAAQDGRVLGLVGPNGAGKSTLLNLIYRLLKPQTGTVSVDGHDIAKLARKDIAKQLSVVAQHAEATLPLPVYDSVALGRIARRNVVQYGVGEDRQRILDALEKTGLTGFSDRLTSELSGGELQRVLIARAIVQDATHLLLDEPTNHLDIHHQYAILTMVRSLATTTVIVLHDLNLAMQFCDDVILLNHGTIVAAGVPTDVLTAERVSEIYRMKAEVLAHHGHTHLIFRAPELA